MKTMREKEVEETRRLLHLWSDGQVFSICIVKRVEWHLDDADALEKERDELRAEVARLRDRLTVLYRDEVAANQRLRAEVEQLREILSRVAGEETR